MSIHPQAHENAIENNRWQFWIDRGGTFTDIVARKPDGVLTTYKLLSENPEHYEDAAVEGIRRLLGLQAEESISERIVETVKMGTTVATNALLERRGEPTVLFITRGFGDALRIGYQNRPRLFDRHIVLPSVLYARVVEVDERLNQQGKVLQSLNIPIVREQLRQAFQEGFRSLAVTLMHAYRHPTHEATIEQLAAEIGFTQISVSHKISPLMKLISRGDTTVVDAYLSPVLRRYVDKVASKVGGVSIYFMQSNGGLTQARHFHGKDAILSGPAGGIVGMVRTAQAGGFKKIIGFDMGGTSTDVSHFAGEFEREFETQVAGVRIRAPMMSIHTVAAGGGSILHFDGSRFRVGPDSAGANPGPAAYRRGGPLTVTDCNVLLGRIQPTYFPPVFGASGEDALDLAAVREKFTQLAREVSAATGEVHTSEHIAEGFIEIAVRNMANAIAKISVARGYDVSEYVLNTFGGAGGQHACAVADHLGIKRVFLHPLAGVLSAYGIGLADVTAMRELTAEIELSDSAIAELDKFLAEAEHAARADLSAQGVPPDLVKVIRNVHLRYQGTDTSLPVIFGSRDEMHSQFEAAYRRRFSFLLPHRPIVAGTVTVEANAPGMKQVAKLESLPRSQSLTPIETVRVYGNGQWHAAALYKRELMRPHDVVTGPAIIADANSTTLVEAGWRADITELEHIVMTRVERQNRRTHFGLDVDPVKLEVFNNLFTSIAEQMGLRLQQTAHSINIKERLDFSCAIFDRTGNLIANAPHIPVHLGSMGESIKTVIRENSGKIRPGDAFAINDPFHGGTHLPDITVITPVFGPNGSDIEFYVGSRGHHADVGGITPGSMPPDSTDVHQEGVLFTNWKLVEAGTLREAETLQLLTGGMLPARNPAQNMADLCAQVAANAKGEQELHRMIDDFGLDVVRAYTQHVQDNAEQAVRRAIKALTDGKFRLETDSGAVINVSVRVDVERGEAVVDFSGTSPQLANNFNAPASICVAAVLFVFRSIVDCDIPLNAGCLKPLKIVIPEGSMLNPRYPAAVVAGNVETSQCITNALFAALGACGASQCTMNCLSFGNSKHQYIETIAGGSGAGPGFDGTDAVHTNMTNSLITDPEVLEFRYPVVLEAYEIRRGTGGAGHWKGGDGVTRRIRFLEPMTVSILSNNRRVPPFGMQGGMPGAVGRNLVLRVDGCLQNAGSCSTVELDAGDTYIVETPGGGGYGSPVPQTLNTASAK